MKKLLSILATFVFTTTAGISVVGCGTEQGTAKKENKLKIEIDKDFIEIDEHTRAQFRITNFRNLEDVLVISNNESIVKITSRGEVIEFKGMKEGSTTILISATGVENKFVQVVIEPVGESKLQIEVDKDFVVIDENSRGSFRITNFRNLENVFVVSNNESVAKITSRGEVIEFKGIKEGSTTIVISATGVKNKFIQVSVGESEKEYEIKLSKIKSEIYYADKTDEIKIQNFKFLKDVDLEVDDKSVINVSLDKKEGTIDYFVFKPGIAAIKVNARNGKPVTIDVKILLNPILLDKPSLVIGNGVQATVFIKNFSSLESVEIVNNNPEGILLKSINGGKIIFKTLAGGLMDITVNAKYSQSVLIKIHSVESTFLAGK